MKLNINKFLAIVGLLFNYMISNQYKLLFISKFCEPSIAKINKINKIQLSININRSLKFVFKNIIWLITLLSGQKTFFHKKRIKRKTSSKTTFTNNYLTIRKKNFFIISKISNVLLPNQENRILKQLVWNNNNFVLNFQKCLTYPELDIIIKNKMNMLIKAFDLILKFNFLNGGKTKDLFFLRYLQLPIKK